MRLIHVSSFFKTLNIKQYHVYMKQMVRQDCDQGCIVSQSHHTSKIVVAYVWGLSHGAVTSAGCDNNSYVFLGRSELFSIVGLKIELPQWQIERDTDMDIWPPAADDLDSGRKSCAVSCDHRDDQRRRFVRARGVSIHLTRVRHQVRARCYRG